MNQYIEVGKKLVPRKLTYNLNVLGAIYLYQMMEKKYLLQQKEIMKDQDYSIGTSSQYSSILKNDEGQENKKKQSNLIKNELFQSIKEFLKQYEFEKIFDTKKVGEYFYDKSLKMCCIDLKVLIEDKTGVFTQNNGWIDKTKSLNTAINELSSIFLQCFKIKYEKKNILDEYLVSFSEIQEFVYKNLVERFKDKQKQSYRDLTKNLKSYVKECIQVKFNIQYLILGFQELNIKMRNWKANFETSYAQFEQELKNKLNIDNDYKVSKVLSYKYIKKMRCYFLQCTLQQLAPFQQNNSQNTEIQNFIEFQFVEYFKNKKLIDGICNTTINKQLQYLIYSIDWIQSSTEANEALKLLEELSKYYMNESQRNRQIIKNQRFSVQLLIEYKFNKKLECQQAKEWWYQNINEKLNLQIIFQVFVISIGLKFNQGQIQNPNYSPNKRNMLIQVL